MPINQLYRDLLLEHAKNPRYALPLSHPHFSSGAFNPSCGDQVIVEGCVADGIITDMSVRARGCVISKATGSLLAEWALHKTIDSVLILNEEMVQQIIGMQLGLLRLQCALLACNALKSALSKLKIS